MVSLRMNLTRDSSARLLLVNAHLIQPRSQPARHAMHSTLRVRLDHQYLKLNSWDCCRLP